MRKLNILITNSINLLGGVELFTIKLGKGLMKLGHNVFFAVRSNSRMEEELVKNHIEPFSIPMNGDLEPVSLYRLYKIITSKKIDITYTTAQRDFRLVGLISKLFIKKGVVSNLGTVWDPDQMIPHNLRYFRNKFLFNFAMLKGITNSVTGKDYISKTWSISPDKLEAIYNGVHLNIYNPGKVTRNTIKEEFKIPLHSQIVSLVGRISPEKGQVHFLNAAKSVLKRFPETYFLVVGESTNNHYYNELKIIWEKMEIKERIIFVGFRSDIQNILADTDILVLPSSQEGLPNVVLEAMAMYRPVIASNVCATSEVVKDGINGFLLNTPINVSELYNKIDILLSDSELRHKMGIAGRKLIEDQFNIENNIKDYEKVFYSLANIPNIP